MIPDSRQKREELERVLESAAFRRADRHRRFLRFVVEGAIEGRQDQLKETVIAVEVYGKSPDYDPQVDSSVRVDVSRLRQRLRDYYGGEGAANPWRIEIPIGGYVPHWVEVAPVPIAVVPPTVPPSPRIRYWLLGSLLALAALGVAYYRITSRESIRPAPPPATPSANPLAMEAFLRGQELSEAGARRQMEEGKMASEYELAIPLFEKAVSIDPSFAAAWAGLAVVCDRASYRDPHGGDAYRRKAKESAARAIRLQPGQAAAHWTLGNLAMYADWDFRLADRELALAMQNDPTYFDAVSGYFDLLLILGRTAEAGHVLEQALALRPATASLRLERALLFYLDGRWDDCIAETTVAGTLDPMDTRAPWQRGLCQEGKRDFPMAEAEYRKCLSVSPHDLRAETALGHLLGRIGKREEALAIARSMEREAAEGKPAAYRLALVWNGLGDKNRALDWLERAVASRDRSAIYLKIERRLEDLHSEPRFLALVRQMGLGPVR